MSVEFIQDRVMLTRQNEKEEDYVKVLYMPREKYGDEFNKQLIEASINLLQFVSDLSPNLKSYDSDETQWGIQDNQLHAIKAIAGMLQYLVNSSSWQLKDMKSYDSIELSNRLMFAINLLQPKERK